MNKKGSALIWAAIVGMIVAVVAAAVAAATVSYVNRTLLRINENQAYLTSRSVVESAAAAINAETDFGKALIQTLEDDGECVTNNIGFDGAYGKYPGLSDLTASITDGIITLSSTTKVVDAEKTVSLSLRLSSGSARTLGTVFPSLYAEDDYVWTAWKTPSSGLTLLNRNANNTYTVVGNSGSGDSRYFVNESSDFNSNSNKKTAISALGTGNIYIFIKSGCEFHAESIELSTEMTNIRNEDGTYYAKAPSVYIIAEAGASVYLAANNYDSVVATYIYAPYDTSEVIIGANSGKNHTYFYGSAIAKNLTMGGNQGDVSKVTVEYIHPFNDSALEGGSSDKWEVIGYEVE